MMKETNAAASLTLLLLCSCSGETGILGGADGGDAGSESPSPSGNCTPGDGAVITEADDTDGSAPGIQVEFECSIDGCEAGERTDLVLTRVDDGTDRSFYATYDGRGEITIGPVTVEPGSTYEVSLFVFGCTAVPETFSIVVSP